MAEYVIDDEARKEWASMGHLARFVTCATGLLLRDGAWREAVSDEDRGRLGALQLLGVTEGCRAGGSSL